MNKEHPKIKKRTVYNAVFLTAILLLTLFSLFHGQSIPDLIEDLKEADGRWILMAVLCVLFYLMLQGVIIWLELRALNIEKSLWKCILISFHGYFFCSITPMQSGGPPMQIYDMKKEGIRFADASIVILIVTFLFKLVLVVTGLGMVFIGFRFVFHYLWGVFPVFLLGMALTVSFTMFVGMFIFHPSLAKRIVDKLMRKMRRRRIFKRVFVKWPNLEERLLGTMGRYRETAVFFKEHRLLMVVLFLVTMGQRFFFFASTWFVYRGFGLDETSIWVIVLLQAAISISADLLPLPGGLGISEAMFMIIFRPIFGAKMLLPGLVLSRGITYYGQLLICGVMTIVAKLVLGKTGKHTPAVRDSV